MGGELYLTYGHLHILICETLFEDASVGASTNARVSGCVHANTIAGARANLT